MVIYTGKCIACKEEGAICVSNYGSFSCKCKNGYSGNGKLCEGSLHKLLLIVICTQCNPQILMSVLWIFTTVPKPILNVLILLVVIIAAVYQATQASPVTVMAVLYTVYFCYLAKLASTKV